MPPGSARKGVGVPPHDMSARPGGRVGSEAVVMPTHPGPTALDLVGPQRMLAAMAGAAVQVVARILGPIRSDTGLAIVPDASFEEAPQAPDILFGPGAVSGTLAAMEDAPTVDVVPRGQAARDVTSTCTGALILGRAGLLQGPGARPRPGSPPGLTHEG